MAEPIPIRPGIEEPTWPAGYRAALSVVVRGAAGDRTASNATYAPARVRRLSSVLADVGVQGTMIWTPEGALAHPELVTAGQEAGHDLAITVETVGDPSALSAALDTFSSRVRGNPPGIVLPAVAAGAGERVDRLVVALGEAGFGWAADPFGATDLPTALKGPGDKRIARLPLTPGASDEATERGATADTLMLTWRDTLDVLRDEGGYMTLSLAAWRSGQPGYSRAVARFLDYLIDLGDVWIARAGDVAAWATRSRASRNPPEAESVNADLVLYNGLVKTMDRLHPTATAVAIHHGRIVAVGTDAEVRDAAGPALASIDLRGRTVTPGLNDAHAHPKLVGLALLDVDLTVPPGTPMRVALGRLAEAASAAPGDGWLVGRGYDDNLFAERRHPTRHDIDALVRDRPVLLIRADYHIGVANSAALALAGIGPGTPDPDGGIIDRDEHGEPTGVLRETALDIVQRVRGEPTEDDLAAALVRAAGVFHASGITSVAEAGIRNAAELTAYQRLHREGRLTLRTYLMMLIEETLGPLERLGVRTGFGDDRLRVGPAKLFADGTIGGRTAKMREPFVGETDNTGLLMLPPEVIKARVLRAHRAGFQVAIHAIGDAAIDLVLDAYEEALRAEPRPDHRHRIEHCSIVDEATIMRIAHLGAIAIPGTSFLYFFRDGYVNNLGLDRIRYAYGLDTYHRHGVVAAASSDAPVIPVNAAFGLASMVTRRDQAGDATWPEEAVPLDDALRAYTVAGAYASFEEDIKGTLRPGMLADIAVFSDDLDAVPPADLASVTVDLTISGGDVVYERPT